MRFIGTAGWSVPRAAAQYFPTSGTHLQRYAQVLNCVEINSSFYRSHSLSTYQRWAASTPPSFKFSVKLPRAITHEAQLRHSRALLEQFLKEINGLGSKLGPLLVQLPPSMKFDVRVATRFFVVLRDLYHGAAMCEPRHATWFQPHVDQLLRNHHVSRVAADPPMAVTGSQPGGDTQLVYYRLHGSPRTYWSNYSVDHLDKLADEVKAYDENTTSWVIFDNTAAGYAALNALQMRDLLE